VHVADAARFELPRHVSAATTVATKALLFIN
jgi:hypothetical protein